MSTTRCSLLGVVFVLALLVSSPARARLSCQDPQLKRADCTSVDPPWNAQDQLYVTASCNECTGSGSDISCSTEEKVTAGALSLKTSTNQPVAGTFTQVGTCDIGVPLFRFSGTLGSNQSYYLVLNEPAPAGTLLLTFATSNSEGARDSSVVGRADGGGTLPGGEPAADGSRAHDDMARGGDGSGSPGGDGGCSCQMSPVALPSSAGAMLLLALLVLRRSR